MKNYVQKGDVLNITAGADLTSGTPVVFGNSLAIPQADIANGAVGAVVIEGVVNVKKASAKTYAAGALVDWDVSAAQVDTAAATGDLTGFGIAVAAAASGDTSIDVKLLPGAATVHA